MNRSANKSPRKTNGTRPADLSQPLPDISMAERDRRALSRLDWIALLLIAMALWIAPLWAAGFATPSAPQVFSGGFTELMNGLGLPLVSALTALAFGIVAWREWKRPVAVGAVPGLAGAVALLGAWAALSLLRTPTIGPSLNALAALFTALMLGGLASRLARDRNGFAALLVAILVAASLVSVLGIQEYLFQALPPPRGAGVTDHRTFATFINPDFLAGYLLLTLPITLSAFAATARSMPRLAFGVALGLQTACLLLTGSRAGVVVLFATLLAWLALAAASRAAVGRGKRIAAGLAVLAVCAVLGSATILGRVLHQGGTGQQSGSVLSAVQSSAEAQSHSGNFRRYTWIGSFKMATANPLLGVGIGAFAVSYPHYAETAFTAHAHNSYLQWADETGLPGALFLLTALAAATAFATHVLLLHREDASVQGTDKRDEGKARAQSKIGSLWDGMAFDTPRLLLVGLLATVLASLLKSLVDSDWYVVGTVCTLSAVLALLVAMARDLAPLATQTPRPLLWEIRVIGALVAVFLLWRAVAAGVARIDTAGAFMESPSEAVETYRAAIAADPLDPEPHLQLAQIQEAMGNREAALQELLAAVRVAPTGKSFYLLGKHYARGGDTQQAIDAFERARDLEPHNLQVLHMLGDTLRDARQLDQAAAIYETMTALEKAPYGTVRAIPEVPETEFAYAHERLAEMAFDAGRWPEATGQYAQAADVLGAYWKVRDSPMNIDRIEKRQMLAALYDTVLAQWQKALQKQRKTTEAAQIARRQAAFRAEYDATLTEWQEAAKSEGDTREAQSLADTQARLRSEGTNVPQGPQGGKGARAVP